MPRFYWSSDGKARIRELQNKKGERLTEGRGSVIIKEGVKDEAEALGEMNGRTRAENSPDSGSPLIFRWDNDGAGCIRLFEEPRSQQP